MGLAAGRLNRVVEVLRQTSTISDTGAQKFEWALAHTYRAASPRKTGYSADIAGERETWGGSRTYLFRRGLDVREDDRLREGGTTWAVVKTEEDREIGSLEVFCEKVDE